ncbi:MAG: M61 family metallopeptidase [Gammaproteobacteria bacterium]|nr:M61 family metallopeptidase [Gammaproteobacteria bacterium]
MKVVFVLVIILTSSFIHAAINTVNYSIKIADADHHLAEVTVLFPHTDSKTVDFIMPAWRLGYYKVLNLANGIRHLRVTDTKGNDLKAKKVDKNTWRVYLDKPTKIAVSYQLYANQLARRARHIDDTHAYLDGVSTFIYSPEFIDKRLTVELDVPYAWRSRSGMKRRGKHKFEANNYHILASSPIETGIHEYYTFEADDKDYELVIWGKGNFDGKKIVEDYKKMVVEHGKMWGGYPFQKYLFIVHATSDATGATEHINSTVIQRDAMGFADKIDYQSFLSTSSHEFIHTWNVKAYRPIGIWKYDYTQENYSDLLWISEGSTSYFSDQLLVRAGLLTAKDYLIDLAEKVQIYIDRPGRKVMTAQQSSFDAWIEDGGDRANNSSVNIYTKGNMLSLLMDVELLKSTDATEGYAQLHKLLYERFPISERGFSSQDIQDLLKEISGKDFSKLWKSKMESVGNINFKDLFLSLGLEMSHGDSTDQDIWTGIIMSELENNNKISMVPQNTPAWKAGLAADDILVAINGIKVQEGKFKLLINKFNAEDEVKVTFFRRNLLKETVMELESKPSTPLELTYIENATELQKKMYAKWLGVDWPADEKESQSAEETE